jgi:hypothetical protein
MWSAVCSLTSTAGRLPGEKMIPGGGVARSRARIMERLASDQRGRNLRSARSWSQDPRRKHVSSSVNIVSFSHVSWDELDVKAVLYGLRSISHQHTF